MRSSYPFCFLLVLLFSACQPSGTEKEPEALPAPPLDTVFHRINAEVLSHGQTFETLVEAIETIGHRLTGSENGARAEQFAFDRLKSYGYGDVEFFPFSVNAWARDTVSMTYYYTGTGSSGQAGVEAVCLAHSPVHFDDSAELLDLGNGLRRNFEARAEEIPGKFVLLNLGLDGSDSTDRNLHRSEKTTLAIEYGAKGVVFVNSVDGGVLLTGAASVTGELIPIPAVCIGKESGEDLRSGLEASKLSAHISMKNRSEMIEARNVVARIPGRDLPNEKILIGGHLDSWDLATGAIDNGVGSFTVLEIARIFKVLDLHPRRTVEFVLFMGEEQGLLGSTAMVEHLEKESLLDQIKYMMNLDMTGNPIGFHSMGRTEAEDWLGEIGAKIKAQDTIFRNTLRSPAGLHSDHQSFMLRGIPILGMESNLDPYVYRFYHSNGDNADLLNREHLHNTARFAAMALYAVADADSLPVRRLSDHETRDFLIAQGLKEKLVLGKEWKWED